MYSGGQPLVELFHVRFFRGSGGEAPAGTVSIFDGKRGQIIYSGEGSPVDKTSSIAAAKQSSGCWLPLTGPYRAISADGCIAIVVNLHHHTAEATPPQISSHVAGEILLDVYDEATRHDERTTSSVSSPCGVGRAEVTYALLSDAAEAIVEVRLLDLRPGGSIFGGRVIAWTDLGEVLLFGDDCASLGTGTDEETDAVVVPLSRSVVAVPLTLSLTVEVDLVIGDGNKIVKESVVCVPKLGREEVCHLPAAGVEVKVTWLD